MAQYRVGMRKIPTLFRRDPDDLSRVLREVHPECAWVLAGEGVATRKYDGTCTRFDGQVWWARREVKPGKSAPSGFVAEETDEATGKTVGWEPMEASPFVKAFRDANSDGLAAGTYELVGPKVQGNPEGYDSHALVRHGADVCLDEPAREFDALMAWLLERDGQIEGLVWHHPDGRMAKLKVRDALRTVGVRA